MATERSTRSATLRPSRTPPRRLILKVIYRCVRRQLNMPSGRHQPSLGTSPLISVTEPAARIFTATSASSSTLATSPPLRLRCTCISTVYWQRLPPAAITFTFTHRAATDPRRTRLGAQWEALGRRLVRFAKSRYWIGPGRADRSPTTRARNGGPDCAPMTFRLAAEMSELLDASPCTGQPKLRVLKNERLAH